jgi:outer membrane protein TolC
MPAPPAWGSEPADAAAKTYGGAVDSTWWNSFHDTELTSLVTRLAKENLDLKAAVATAETGVAVASFYPDVSLSGHFGTED